MAGVAARRARGFVRLVHPFPSALNAVLVVGLAVVAGGGWERAAALGLAMLGLQFSIGAFNDACDIDLDRGKPAKPIPAGLVSRQEALIVAAVTGLGGLLLAATSGLLVLVLATAMLAAGLAYDAWLKRGPFAWTAFAVAFPLLPLYAWYGAVAAFPPRPELLLPVAALAGPMLQLANGLTDLERDARAGVDGLAPRLGRRNAVLLLALLQAVVHALAWLTIVGAAATPGALTALAVASVVSAAGLGLSASSSPERRQWGWHAQAIGVALLAIAWLALATGASAER